MTERALLDVMISSGRASVLAGVRRVEAALLVALSGVLLAHYGLTGIAFAAPLVASAVMLLPRQRSAASTREERRRRLLSQLLDEAFALRAAYMNTRPLPLSLQRSQSLHEARREIIRWVELSRTRLRRHPEFAGIFEAHGARGGLLDELDRRISRLADIRRLEETSRRLKLPI